MIHYLSAALASLVILAVNVIPVAAGSGHGIRSGVTTIDATSTDVQLCTNDFVELGLDSATTTAPYVFFGKMKGAFDEGQVEVDLFTDQGALNDTTFGCRSGYAAICLPGNPSNQSMIANLTVCKAAHQELVRIICFGKCPTNIDGELLGTAFDVMGGWQIATSDDPSVINAWGILQGSIGPASPSEYGKIDRPKLTLKSLVERTN